MALWTPADLGSAVQVWLAETGHTGADADPISTWEDSSANNRDATAVTTTRPLRKLAIQNGLAVARFDGTDDFMDMGASVGLAAQPFTICFVGTSTADAKRWITGKTSQIAVSREATASWQMFAGSFRQYAAGANTAWHVHVVHFAGASSYGSLDGTATTPASPGTGAPTNGAMLGSNNAGSGNFHAGDMGEVLIVTGAHSLATQQNLEGYLAHKWGLEANLPASHPYLLHAPGEAAARTGLRYPLGTGLRQRTLR